FAALAIEYGLAPGYTLQQAQAAIDRAVAGLTLPPSIYTGQSAEDDNSLQATLRKQPWLILGVLVTVYLVLGILYESTLHPLTILSTLPSAGVGALLALRLVQMEFSLIALLGLFLLIGVVMKNAILMIDFALALHRRSGCEPGQAIPQAAQMRLRPSLITNLTALLCTGRWRLGWDMAQARKFAGPGGSPSSPACPSASCCRFTPRESSIFTWYACAWRCSGVPAPPRQPRAQGRNSDSIPCPIPHSV